ncbi:hypothetical protein MRX96_052116 [Rhipicephalus microplus]
MTTPAHLKKRSSCGKWLDRVNLNASDDKDKTTSMAGNTSTHELAESASRAPHLSLAIERLDPEDIFQSAKKGECP